jgi:TP901 family phage tail tape measure protein
MATPELSPIAVRFTVDTSGLDKAVSAAKDSGGKIAKQLDNAGKKAGKLFAAGIGAATAAVGAIATTSVKAFADFESKIAQIEGLVGVTGEELDKLSEAAKRLGPEFGQSGNEAAEALFFITSAGLRGQEAIDVLEASLKASTVGLGDVTTIADLATSAMNAYGTEVLSATDATDVLTAAVREGKLAPEELSGAMGAVLPVASAMGISFSEVGATFAAMSRTGTGASEAATQLRGIMTSILKPTDQAEQALNGMGLSSAGLQQQIKDKGLLSVLETLTESFADNEVGAQAVFGNVRALSGVMDLMGTNVEGTRQIFNNMADSTGILDEAFAATSETAEFKFNQAMAQIRSTGLEIGGKLLPVLATLFVSLSPIIEKLGLVLIEAFDAAMPAIEEMVAALPGLLEALLPIIPAAIEIVRTMLELATAVLPALLPMITLFTENAPLIIGLAGAFFGLVQVVKAVTTVVAIMNAVMALNPITLVVIAVAALVAGIVYLATQTTFFQELWERMTRDVQTAWQNVTTFFTAAGETIKTVFQTVATTIQNIWNGVTTFIGNLVNQIGEKIKGFFTGIITFVQGLGSQLFNIGKSIWQKFVDGALDALFALPRLAGDIISKVPGLGGIGNAINTGISNIKSGVSNALTGGGKQAGGTTVVNNYNQSISARGLTVSQVQQSAQRRGTLMRPVGTKR